ncbi:hypothetical protein P8C59_002675 [Phyllachora maydis]|uniref:Uncharacterized protein n=1 Tax=Phyllachora maydis TaxID=1825666 RepID=A0AAD9HYU7_9PEZI|nr:hypothetical protein P8C59_002675 [Phyllachora maydis]
MADQAKGKASVEDSVSAIKNMSSTLASLTHSSNATTTGKTSYSPRFDPFSSTMDLDSPLRPPRKEPYLGPAVNSATTNLDPPIDIGSKEGFKDTIASSIVKELSKKAYTIPDATKLSREKESRNPAIGVYRAAYIANSSNSTPNFNSNPSKKGKNKKKGKKKASYDIKGHKYSAKSAEQASFMLGFYNLAIEKKRNLTLVPILLRPINTGNGPISPASIGSITLEVLSRKAPPTYTKLVLDNVLYLPNININIISGVRHYDLGGCLMKETLYRGERQYIAVLDFEKLGFFLDVKGSSKPILYANFAFPLGLTSYNTTKSIELQCNKIVVEIPSNSIRKEDYRPIIEDAIVSEAIEPTKRYKLRNSPARGIALEGIGPSLRGEPKPLTGTRDLPFVLREPVIEGNKVVEKAISSPTLKEPYIVDLDLDLERAVSLDPSNLNTKKPISIEKGPSKLEPYESSSNSKLDEPLPDKPINPVIVESTRPTISIEKPELSEAFP